MDRISEIRQQEEFMKNSGCPDIDRASCRFLAKAIDDVKSLPEEADHLEKCEEEIAALRIKRDEEISKKQDEICIIGYDAERLELLIRKARALVKYENLKKDAEKKKLEIARLETEKNTNSKTIGQYEEILLELNIKAQKATDIVAALSDSVIKHDDAVCKRNSVAHFADQEKELPVYEERKQHIDKRLTELYQERSKEDANELVLHNNLREAEIKLEELRKDIEGSEALEEVERRLKSTKETLEKAQIQKGVLTQRVEDVEAMRSEIALLNKGIAVAAEKADCYEALKQAFSQDGVPHQIIRNIIPHITDTTNNILGQMTGGTMGVEFVMERTVKGKDGDKATLDVLINEYGKTTLPYASKSGGEKVKASLAVILALSEIKATAAGRIYQLPTLLNTFASIEPLLEDIDENISALKYLNWIIIGAETGHRKEKVIPKFEWIKRIVVEADYNGIPVFMKDSLVPIIGEKNMRRDYPKELQIRKRSEKVNKRLSGSCMLCGKTEDKNKMVTLTARAVRGGKATSFGHMCHSCFAKWLTSHNIPVPDLENKKEIEDGKEKL